MEKNGKEFEFNYTAPSEAERKEIVSIRRQYEPQGEKKESKMERLRRLDAHVKNSANARMQALRCIRRSFHSR